MQTFFAIFVLIFIKFSPKCRTKKLGMIYTILGSLCSFLNWEGDNIRPQIGPWKIPGLNEYNAPATKLMFLCGEIRKV